MIGVGSARRLHPARRPPSATAAITLRNTRQPAMSERWFTCRVCGRASGRAMARAPRVPNLQPFEGVGAAESRGFPPGVNGTRDERPRIPRPQEVRRDKRETGLRSSQWTGFRPLQEETRRAGPGRGGGEGRGARAPQGGCRGPARLATQLRIRTFQPATMTPSTRRRSVCQIQRGSRRRDGVAPWSVSQR